MRNLSSFFFIKFDRTKTSDIYGFSCSSLQESDRNSMKLCTSRTKRFKSSVPEGGELAWEGLRAKGSFLFSYSCMFNCLVLISPAINSWAICLIFMFYVAFWLVLSFRISHKVSITLSLLLLLLHPPRFPFPPILCSPPPTSRPISPVQIFQHVHSFIWTWTYPIYSLREIDPSSLGS